MAGTPEVVGQDLDIKEEEVVSLASTLDAPDDPEEKVVEDVKENVEEEVVAGEKEGSAVDETEGTGSKEEDPAEKTVEPVEPVVPDQTKIIQQLRQMRKDMALNAAVLQRQNEEIQRLRTAAAKAAVKPEDDSEDLLGIGLKKEPTVVEEPPVKLSEIEQLQQEIQQIGQTRGEQLVTLVEVMAVSPDYKDVKEVCSRENLNDLVEAMAEKVSAETGTDQVVAAMKVEAAIWKQPNPYKWMYDTIKEHHPRYAKKEEVVTPTASTPVKEPKGRAPKPVEAPPSVIAVGGNDAVNNASWTAAKLDVMDDADYAKVPEKIRNAYLTGQLA
jgi:hypothetical protein